MRVRTLSGHRRGVLAKNARGRFSRINAVNQRVASSLDISKVLNQIPKLDMDSNGVVKFDPNNPVHRMWLED